MPRYFELASITDGIFSRNMFFPVEQKDEVIKSHENSVDIYTSVYDYESPVQLSSSSPFDGLPKYGDLYFDLDSTDLALANSEADELRTFLSTLFSIPVEDIPKYFSGAKGYHVLVNRALIKQQGDKNLHRYYKALAEYCKQWLELTTLDLQVYDARRVFRVPSTINSKTGSKKELVEGKENVVPYGVPSLDLEPFLLLGIEKPRSYELMDTSERELIKRPIEPFMLRLMNSEIDEGKRNTTCYTIALYLKDHGYSKDEAFGLLRNSPIGLEDREKANTIKSAYSSNKHFGLTNNEIVEENMTDEEKIQLNVDDITNLLVPWNSVISSTRTQIDKFQKKQLLSYGLDNLDKYLGMVQATELVVVGGVSGIGKSEFVWNMAKSNAKAGIPVAFIGLEMTPEQYALRMLRNKLGIEGSKFKTMDLSDEEKTRMHSVIDDMDKERLPIYFFNPKFKLDVPRLERLVKAATEKFNVKLWIIDHLHYFPVYSTADDQTAAIANIVTSIKQMTLKYDIPIILVSHYRKLGSGVSPSLNSFKDSITIPQVADTVLALNRNLISNDVGLQRRVEIAILKSRYGMPSATLMAQFNPDSGEYEPLRDFSYGLKGNVFD